MIMLINQCLFVIAVNNKFTLCSKQTVLFNGDDIAKSAYRIQNCFSTISTKFLVNRSYFVICGEFLSANFCESPIFSPYTVIYLLFQLSWLLAPCLTINFGDFLCDLFVELPNFSQILLTSTVIIFVFLPVLLPNLVIIFIGPESDHWLCLSVTD